MSNKVFPDYDLVQWRIKDYRNFKFDTVIRVLRGGVWYDVHTTFKHSVNEVDVVYETKDELRHKFFEQCVRVLTLWEADDRNISPDQSYPDQDIKNLKIENE